MAQPGDVVIDHCTLTSPRGIANLANFLSAVIYESIMAPNCIIELQVLDSNDVLGNLNVTGDEFIDIGISAPGTPQLDYHFALDKISLDSIEGTQKSKKYTLHGVGQETLVSKSKFVQKAYKDSIDNIVQDIHKTFLNAATTLITEATHGAQQLIIPNLKPFEAIEMLRGLAVSIENPSSLFTYFETGAGHNFKSIEGMMNSGVVKVFQHSDALPNSIFNNEYNNIIDYDIPQIISSTDRIDLGGLKQRIATYDIRTRKYEYKDQQMNRDGKFGNPGDYNSSFFKSLYGTAYNFFSLIAADSVKNTNWVPQTTPLQMSYLSNLMQGWITAKVYGDTNVKAGDMVTLNIPQAIALTGTQELDPQMSGDYLVSRLSRNIRPLEEQPRYFEVLECVSGGLTNGVT